MGILIVVGKVFAAVLPLRVLFFFLGDIALAAELRRRRHHQASREEWLEHEPVLMHSLKKARPGPAPPTEATPEGRA